MPARPEVPAEPVALNLRVLDGLVEDYLQLAADEQVMKR